MTETKLPITVVDDDSSVLKSLGRLLRSAGYAVSTFDSAEEFLGSVASSLPRCLVLDVHMPAMNGFELLARLRDLGIRLPVIFITAQDTQQMRATARRWEPARLLIKPFPAPALLEAIDCVLVP